MKKMLDISQSRAELDRLEKEIIKALAERKEYQYNPKAHTESASIVSEIYLPILKMLCREGTESEEAMRIDLEILSLIQKRISKARKIMAYKKQHNIEVYDKEREKELLENAGKYSREFNLNPEIGMNITELILRETKEPTMFKHSVTTKR